MDKISSLNLTVDIIPILEDNFLFIISNKYKYWVVDPGDAEAVLQYSLNTNKILEGILITHDHADHIGGLTQLLEKHPQLTCFASPLSHAHPDCKKIEINQTISVLNSTVTVLNLSGHTKEQIGFYFQNEGWLFSGDALFHLGCGRVFSGTMQEAYDTLQRLKRLPDHTYVFCSHDYSKSNARFFQKISQDPLSEYENSHKIPFHLGLEKKWNPFLKAETLSAFTQLRKDRNIF